MNVGKCLSKSDVEALGPQSQDPRNFGCYDDVTGLLNKRCFNENQCEFKVVDLEQLKHSSCIPGLKMYLLASYICLPGKMCLVTTKTFSAINRKHLA